MNIIEKQTKEKKYKKQFRHSEKTIMDGCDGIIHSEVWAYLQKSSEAGLASDDFIRFLF